jgi:acetyl-CoA decarbonylase/synthase complex subunit gamma
VLKPAPTANLDLRSYSGYAAVVGSLARETNCPLAVKGANLDEIAALTDQLTKVGIKDIVIDTGSRSIRQAFNDQIFVRKAALAKTRSLGFPTIFFACDMTEDPMKEALIASMAIAKYAAIVVLSDFQGTVFSRCWWNV